MSYGGGFYGRTERVRQAPHYDQVPQGSLSREDSYDLQPLREQRAPHLAHSADPLPPPPLPDQPPVGPEFDPSGSEDNTDPDPDPAIDIKPVHRFIPDSWKNFFRGSNRSSNKPWSMPASSCNNNNSTTEGVRCSPPHSPSVPGSYRDPYGGSGGSYNSRKELLEGPESVSGHTYRTGLTYSERVEEYHQRYGYMKSWAGLLRILGCVELLLGAAVFACVCAYIPSGHIPKPVVVPDYIAKYPTIRSDEERDQYRAVFNDQYAEYKEIHSEVQATLKKFDEMDAMMRSLPHNPTSQMEVDRINRILQEYQRKKNDPTFLEKKERCEYLKSKLSHIKQKIQEYDKVMEWNDGYS